MSGLEPLGGMTVSAGKWFLTTSHSEHRGHIASYYFAAALECKGLEQKSIEEAYTPLFGYTIPNVDDNKHNYGAQMSVVYEYMHELFFMILTAVQTADATTQFLSEMWAPSLFDKLTRRISWGKNKLKKPFAMKKGILSPEEYWDRMKAADMLMLKPLKDIRLKVGQLSTNTQLPTWEQYQSRGNTSKARDYQQRAVLCERVKVELEGMTKIAKTLNPKYFAELVVAQSTAATIYGLTAKDKAYLKLVGKVVKTMSNAIVDENAMQEEDESVLDFLLVYVKCMYDDRKKKDLKKANQDIEDYLNKRRS